MNWVAHFLLLLFVAVSSGAIGWVLGVDEAKRQAFLRGLKGEEEPCHHLGGEKTSFPCMDAYDDFLSGRITREEYGLRRDSFSVTTCLDCGEALR